MTEKLFGLDLLGEVPEEDETVHAGGGDVFAGGVEVERHY